MSSPSGRTNETHSQDLVHANSQFVAGTALKDIASSIWHTGTLPGSSSTISTRAPNTAYTGRLALTQEHSASLGLRRSPLPLVLSVAQHCARLVEQIAASAMSSIGRIVDETHCVRELVEATSAEARSVRREVESKVATLVAKVDARTVHAVEEITGCVR